MHRVDAGRAWSGTLLRRLLDRSGLSPVDEALATELALGTLRHRGEVDWALAHSCRTPLEALPPPIRAVLRMGAYQVLFLDRIPHSAACWEAVELAKRVGHPGTARLVNAVLRRLAAAPAPIPTDDTPAGIALRHSHPTWLVDRWVGRFGTAEARALCAVNNETPPATVRLNTLRGTPEDLAARLASQGVETRPSAWVPEGRFVSGSPGARRTAFEAGWLTPQDEGSMLVAHLVHPSPGETVIDACAAPGGKTTHLAALMKNRGRVIACDIHAGKLAEVSRHCARLGVTIVMARALDAAALGSEYPGMADRVLVDAPCSGLGVLRRRPEIKWRLHPSDLEALARRQRRLLWGASAAVRSGGRLVYSVCTLEPEEGPEVAEAFLREHPEFEAETILGPGGPLFASHRATESKGRSEWPPGPDTLVSALAADAPWVILSPHRTGTDGFFVAAFRRAA